MDKQFIKRINKAIRNTRPNFLPDKLCSVFISGDLLEIGFLSKQCRNDMVGACLLCDYGRMDRIGTHQTYIEEMKEILSQYSAGIKYLLLCSNGSILDEFQIPTELLKDILHIAQNCNIPEIIIETHYRDISALKLNLIRNIVHKPITIEMGLETINHTYQDAFFMKGIEIEHYEKTISLIKEYGYDIELNLMLGLPFLSVKEQLNDAKNTINWIHAHGCTPVVFPINIKPHTMLRYIYDKGLYQPISLWLLVLLLDELEPEILKHVIVAWYGNRDESYPDDISTILPQNCVKCNELFVKFFRDFLNANQYVVRKKLIQNLFTSAQCDCLMRLKKQMTQCERSDFFAQYNHFYEQLERDFG